MKKINYTLAKSLLILFIGLYSMLAISQTVSLKPDLDVCQGNTFDVPITITADNIGVMSFYIDYDGTKVSPVSFTFPGSVLDYFIVDTNRAYAGMDILAINFYSKSFTTIINYSEEKVVYMRFRSKATATPGATQLTLRTTIEPVCGMWANGFPFPPITGVTYLNANITLHEILVPTVTIAVTTPVTGFPVCPGTSVTFTATPSLWELNPSYQWKKNGNPIAGATGSTFTGVVEGTSGTLAYDDLISVVLTSSYSCASPTTVISNEITVRTTYPPFIQGTIGSNQSICYQAIPGTLTSTTPIGGNSGPYYYQWQSSSDDIVYTNIADANSINYSPGPLSTSTYFRAQQWYTGDCGTVTKTTNSVLITVHDAFVSGTVGIDQTICYNGTFDALTTNPSGGVTPYTYQWYSSPDHSVWTPVDLATNPDYSATLTSTTYYKVFITSSGGCGSGYTSNYAMITVRTMMVAGAATSSQTICNGGTPDDLNANFPSGGTGTFSYKWQEYVGTDFSDIDGATAMSYSPGPLTGTKIFRQKQIDGGCLGNPTTVVYTNQVKIDVYSLMVAGSATGTQTICNGGSATLNATAASSGSGTFKYNWQKFDGSIFSDISGATAMTYSTGALTEPTIYRQRQTDFGCGTNPRTDMYTNAVTIDVLTVMIAGSATATQTICTGGTITALNATAASGGSNSFSYIWQRFFGTQFVDISGATAMSYLPGASSGIYRQKQTDIVCGSNPTTVKYTNEVTITVHPVMVAGTAAKNQTICNGGTPAPFTATVATGGSGNFSYLWQISDGTAFSDIPGATAMSYLPAASSGIYRQKQTDTFCGSNPTTVKYTNEVTITVHPVMVAGTASEDQVICNGGTPDPLTATLATGGSGTFSYIWQIFDGAAFSDIEGATAMTYAPGALTATKRYRQKQTDTFCESNPTTVKYTNEVKITVNPFPTVGPVSNQVVCNESSTAAINFTTTVPGTFFNWTNTTTSIGLAAIGTGNIASFTAINTGTVPVTATVTVTPGFTGGGITCYGTPVTFTILVNPTPGVTPVLSSVYCNGDATTPVNFTGPVSGTTYAWTNSNPAIGLAASGTGDIASFTAANSTNAPISALISVIPTANGCAGSVMTFTITVNPTPTVNTVANQLICNGLPTDAVNFTGAVAGTVYNWVNSTPSIGLAASGTGDIGSFTATNTSTMMVTATITVTPTYSNGGVTCTGTPTSFIIQVRPIFVEGIASEDQTICYNTVPAPLTSTGPTGGSGSYSYQWYSSTNNINWSLIDGATNASYAPGVMTVSTYYVVEQSDDICGNMEITNSVLITVNPFPTVGPVSNQVVCNGSATTAINFTTTVPGTFFNWTNTTTSIGLAAIGTGNIASFTAINTGTDPVIAIVIVTPGYTGGGITCYGTPVPFIILVNPTPGVSPVLSSVYCSGDATTPVNFTGPLPGTTYAWTNSNTAIGLAASGTGDIASFTAANSTNAPISALISVIPTANGCAGPAMTFTIVVNPTPTVDPFTDATFCNGDIVTTTIFTGPVSGTTYAWTNSNPAIGLAASGTANLPSFTATNATVAPISGLITVIPTANGCTGPDMTFTIVVNPTPTVVDVADQVGCNGDITLPVTFTGATPGTVYNWSNNNPSIGLAASGTGNIAAFTAINTGAVPVTAIVTVTPSFSNGVVVCTGVPITFEITVNPTPTVNAIPNQSFCTGAIAPATIISGPVAGTTYTWTNSNTAIGLAAGGIGDVPSFTAINGTAAPITAVITITPIANTCVGPDATYNIVVNPLPVVTITGPLDACVNSTGNVYTTEAGMTGYIWTVVGGTIVGSATGNSINVTWNTVGTQSVAVNYVDANGCSAIAPTVLEVTVNPLPVPTITGPATACLSSTGNIYTTESGMTGYTWTVSAGGTITAGAGTDAITVTWNTVGSQSISVNYTNSNGCTATAATVKNVTVNALPTPTITGLNVVCAGTTGVAYATQASQTGYVWTVSAGGTITAGAGTNAVFVTWSTAGPQTISVNYANANGCTALVPTVYNVTVNELPVPTITGPASVCINSANNVYTTQAGMTGYTWTVSAGGAITSGSSTNSITVTWSTTGAKTVSVNYSNANNCTAAAPTIYNVTVNSLPVPTITGSASVCQGATNVTYTTQTGMSGYIWTVSSGGTITAGGTSTSNNVTISWNTTGVQAVTVNYTNVNGCTAITPVSYAVTVNPNPVPTIGSNNVPCVGSTGNMYYTESGMTGYVWTVSAGGVIASGQGTSAINVTWNVAGSQVVTVNYNNSFGCPAPTPAIYNLFVNPIPAAAAPITGTAVLCAGTNGVAYSTTPVLNALSYTWTLPAGATIASGVGTTNITVNFGASAVSGNVTVAGTNNCGNGPASSFAVTVNPLPAAAGIITGPASVCAGATGVVYNVPAIAAATSYTWTVPAGVSITAGATTNQITVSFGTSAVSGVITVKGNNTCGSGAVSPNFSVVVNPIPAAPVVTAVGNVLTSNAPSGNQWYYDNTGAIAGATGQSYTVLNNTGWYWCTVTLNGCTSPISNKVYVVVTGVPELPADASFTVYPVPNNGQFTASISYPVDDTFTIAVYNQLGAKLYELRDVSTVAGKFDAQIDIRPVPSGMYTVVFTNSEHKVVKKVLINR